MGGDTDSQWRAPHCNGSSIIDQHYSSQSSIHLIRAKVSLSQPFLIFGPGIDYGSMMHDGPIKSTTENGMTVCSSFLSVVEDAYY